MKGKKMTEAWEQLVNEINYRWKTIVFSIGYYPAILIGWILAKYTQKQKNKRSEK